METWKILLILIIIIIIVVLILEWLGYINIIPTWGREGPDSINGFLEMFRE